MMIKYSHKIILLLLAAGFSISSAAQNDGVRFRSFNTVQLLNGKSSTSASVHTVNGIVYKKFFTGIGAGFDYYYHTSVPLFLETRYDITNRERKLQLLVNAGMHIPFGNRNKKETFKTGDFKAGLLLAAGIDYFVPIKRDAIIVGVGYSQKKVTQMVDNNLWNPVMNRFENIPIREAYEFNRIWLRLGLVF